MKLMCVRKENRGLIGCITCNWDHCKFLTEKEKTTVYHLEEMKNERNEDLFD